MKWELNEQQTEFIIERVSRSFINLNERDPRRNRNREKTQTNTIRVKKEDVRVYGHQ